jgi:8-oxo-dGTP diphosphatase
MIGDGNGWQTCSLGHRHWGRFGAAGLLVTAGDRVMLQHRAAWTHEGGAWALPGGARDSHESAVAAALREAAEETTLAAGDVDPVTEWVDDHGGWSYTTVVAAARLELSVAPNPDNREGDDVRWFAAGDVDGLHLHSGFRAAWTGGLASLAARAGGGRPPSLP